MMAPKNRLKPVLIPARLDWKIASEIPYLKIHETADTSTVQVTFIGLFRKAPLPTGQDSGAGLTFVEDPGPFRLARPGERSRFQVVRMTFEEALAARDVPGWKEGTSLPEHEYDWSQVPVHGDRPRNEPAHITVQRLREYREKTGLEPDPAIYEVLGSEWLEEVANGRPGYHHFLISGEDNYVEVIARRWDWEPGQAHY